MTRTARAAWPGRIARPLRLGALALLAGCGFVTAGIEERWVADALVVPGQAEVAFKAPLEPRRRLELCLVLPAGQGPLTAALDLAGPRAAAALRGELLGPGGPEELEGLRFVAGRQRTLACLQEPAGPRPSGRRYTGVRLVSAQPLRLDGLVARDADPR